MEDANDEIPAFPFRHYDVSVPENAAYGHQVAVLQAQDNDDTAQVLEL